MTSVDLVLKIIDAFENAGVPYLLVGSHSESFYGVPNLKNKCQFVVQMSSDQLSAVVRGLGNEYRMDPQMLIDSTTMTMRYILKHPATAFKSDIFLLGPDPHDRMRFDRRREISFEGTTASLPTVEDVIVSGLRWSAGGTRTSEVENVATLISHRYGRLDLPYIRQWTDQHGTREFFEQLLRKVTEKK